MKEKKYLLVDKETGEVMGEKSSISLFRRLLAGLVLFVSFFVLSIIVSFVLRFLQWCFLEISKVSGAFQVVIYLLVGTTILGIAIAPLYYGVPLTVGLSEGIATSRRGARYYLFAIIAVAFCLLTIISNKVVYNSWSIVYIYQTLYSLLVGVVGVKGTKSK